MPDEDFTPAESLPSYWWIVAVASGLPAYLLYLLFGTQFKGVVMACGIASVTGMAGFYKSIFFRPSFLVTVAILIAINVALIASLPITSYHGPATFVLFPFMAVDAVISYYVFKYIS